ncbi:MULTISPECIES: sugar transferase [Leuconostoc]|uniref:Beta-1,6-galactofuranosyltransferase n=2 Tax=Leuconostoc kimchii TaxID=136609 RepID=D5T2X5_LEUKI|nr:MULTISPECIES: sugar transferase [Leuconostoc]ADG40624.1 hypothetical protein LKI_05415 [Leuconostoc kimchii IMSNU 11154]AEJ31394.1 beta-1,6-galactofuranosyltransferase [Leuconostoc sp. C2]QBR47083.1 beta-1,6-galactofuranosyltransferase [Leuconostoc kimchii]
MTHFITHTIEPWMPLGALKAKSDYADIAVASGWTSLPIYRYNDARYSDDTRMTHLNEWLTPVKSNDLVLHQFPTYMSADLENAFVTKLNQNKIRSAVLIHDIEPLRLNKTSTWEFDVLNRYDTIIVHSEAMKKRLQAAGITSQFIIQSFFDYLSHPVPVAQFSHRINFAGTFQKSPWLQTYTGPQLTLFGSKPKKWQHINLPTTIDYQGNFDPDRIVSHLYDGFGLIWDNDFDDKTYQTYTKYNAPHKASLYLRAGLPLIAWSQSALGQLIVTSHIGLVIDNLDDLSVALKKVDRQQYLLWQTNIKKISENLRLGMYTRQTLKKLN